jgi:hypothetical protein
VEEEVHEDTATLASQESLSFLDALSRPSTDQQLVTILHQVGFTSSVEEPTAPQEQHSLAASSTPLIDEAVVTDTQVFPGMYQY